MWTKIAIVAASVGVVLGGSAAANEYADALNELASSELQVIASSPALVEAIKAQNAEHGDLSEDQIVALDQEWRGQVGRSPAPLIEDLAARGASEELVAAREASEGLLTEVFAMDNRGLNVAMSDVTSDYWQGDEAKWTETFGAGADAVHISEVELDESTQTYQSQVSVTVVDPETGAPIGAVTFGVNIEYLE